MGELNLGALDRGQLHERRARTRTVPIVIPLDHYRKLYYDPGTLEALEERLRSEATPGVRPKSVSRVTHQLWEKYLDGEVTID